METQKTLEATITVSEISEGLTAKGQPKQKCKTDKGTYNIMLSHGKLEIGKTYNIEYTEMDLKEYPGKVTRWIQKIGGNEADAHKSAVSEAERIFGKSGNTDNAIDHNQALIELLNSFEKLHKYFHQRGL